jgi:hypothetical protein
VETPRKFITFIIYYLRGVSTNKTIICFIAMQTYKELNNRQFPFLTIFKTRQGDANKSPQLERAYTKISKIAKFGCEMF